MKALVFNKAIADWQTSRGFELVDIPEPVLGLTAFLAFVILFLVNLTAFSRLASGQQFLFET
ncbi:MAG: hypothetical protein HYZ51_04670 [Candidatus Doudnabacteria bacterium]|nr:hypothetical protein [Candidatus Doudnabacteria bacterium]